MNLSQNHKEQTHPAPPGNPQLSDAIAIPALRKTSTVKALGCCPAGKVKVSLGRQGPWRGVYVVELGPMGWRSTREAVGDSLAKQFWTKSLVPKYKNVIDNVDQYNFAAKGRYCCQRIACQNLQTTVAGYPFSLWPYLSRPLVNCLIPKERERDRERERGEERERERDTHTHTHTYIYTYITQYICTYIYIYIYKYW